MKTLVAALLLLAYGWVCPATAQTVEVPSNVQINTPGLVVIRAAKVDADDVRWWAYGESIQTFPEDIVPAKTGVYFGFALKEGVYRVGVVAAKVVDGKAKIGEPKLVVITVGNPTPPDPPGPGPGPKPPVPPTPGDAPFPSPDGMRVMVLYESAQLSALPKDQVLVFTAVSIRSYLRDKAKGAIWWDKDVPPETAEPIWKTAAAVPHASLPWILIATPTGGFSGPLPGNVADTMALLKKYGG